MSFLVYVIMEYAYICPKKYKKKFSKNFFPQGGIEPTNFGFEVHCLDH